jgi:O-acetyl-ADP-ribose deacetylase (regulator of RNase III)
MPRSESAAGQDSRLARALKLVGIVANWIAVRASRDPRWIEAKDWRTDDTAGGFLTPARVCPRGCTHEIARREFVTRTSLGGQGRVRVRFRFETETCAKCGSKLIDKCGRCKAKLMAPIRDRCRKCGLPLPWSPERSWAELRARPRHWRGEDVHDPAVAVATIPGRGELFAIEGDITNIATDGIVSNDDVDGRMYTVIALSIKRGAGSDIERQSVAEGPFALGEAWYTDAGTMRDPVKGIVHVASIDRRGDTSLDTIRACLHSALDKAREEKLGSLAIAAFGTGPHGTGPQLIDLEKWLDAAGEAIVTHLNGWEPFGESRPPLAVLLVLYEPDDFANAVAIIRKSARRGLDSD